MCGFEFRQNFAAQRTKRPDGLRVTYGTDPELGVTGTWVDISHIDWVLESATKWRLAFRMACFHGQLDLALKAEATYLARIDELTTAFDELGVHGAGPWLCSLAADCDRAFQAWIEDGGLEWYARAIGPRHDLRGYLMVWR